MGCHSYHRGMRSSAGSEARLACNLGMRSRAGSEARLACNLGMWSSAGSEAGVEGVQTSFCCRSSCRRSFRASTANSSPSSRATA